MLLNWFDHAPRRVLLAIAVVCLGLLAFAVTLQLIENIEPCPMCIVQRYALLLTAVIAGVGAAFKSRGAHLAAGSLLVLSAGFGAFTAARQSWLQWYPPESVSCGRDFYGMIETFPLKRAIPLIFRGSGDCAKVDWTFLGLSIANWSFLWFSFFVLVALVFVARRIAGVRAAHRRPAQAAA